MDKQQSKTTDSFNNEVIWGSIRPLFDTYFKQDFLEKRWRLAFAEIKSELTFEEGLRALKYY